MISVSYYLQCPPDGHFVRRDEWCAKECGGWENGKCKHGGTKWAIIPEADHAATQAAIGMAIRAIEPFSAPHLVKNREYDELYKARNELRAVKVNEESPDD